MRSLRLRWRLLTLLAVFALVVAACSSGDDAADETTTTAAAATETTAAATETTAATTETTEAAATETTEAMTEAAEGQLAGMTVVDENTFTVEFEVADPEFPIKTAYAAYYAMPAVAFEDPAAFEESPIGNGPFMMDGVWEHDVLIPLKAYPDYQGPDPAKIDTFEFQIIADIATAYNEALAGSLDVMNGVPSENLATYQTDFPDRNGEAFNTAFTYLGFPTYLPQFTKEHRQALSMAVDRDVIADQIFLGGRDPAHSVIPPNLQGRTDVCASWNFDPEAAKGLWDAAGDPGPITVWFNSGSGHEDWVEAVVNMWGQNLGIDTSTISFETLEFSEYLPVIDNQEITGPFRLGWGQDYPSPLNFLEPLYASYNAAPVGSNSTIYDNPEFDAALAAGKEKVAASGDLTDGLPDYYAAEDLLCDDAQVMPVYFNKTQFVHSDNVSEVYIDSYNDLGYTLIESQSGNVSQDVSEPEHLFPTNSNESEGISVLRALYTGLVQFDWLTNEPFNAHAESMTSDDGGKTWTIVLNPGWTFHDGTPVTAQDYVDTWSFGADGANGQQNNSFYSNIVGYDEFNPE
jgi:ABC-type oligopeptide transport system substrate-binding subunit